jgi:predicted membrane protein
MIIAFSRNAFAGRIGECDGQCAYVAALLLKAYEIGTGFLLTGGCLSHINAGTSYDVSRMSFLVSLHAPLITGVRVFVLYVYSEFWI